MAVTNLEFKDEDDDGTMGELELVSIRQLDDGSYIVMENYSEGQYESSHKDKNAALKYVKEIM